MKVEKGRGYTAGNVCVADDRQSVIGHSGWMLPSAWTSVSPNQVSLACVCDRESTFEQVALEIVTNGVLSMPEEASFRESVRISRTATIRLI